MKVEIVGNSWLVIETPACVGFVSVDFGVVDGVWSLSVGIEFSDIPFVGCVKTGLSDPNVKIG